MKIKLSDPTLSIGQAIKKALAKGLILKPSLRILRSRRDSPKFWTMPFDTITKEIFVEGGYEKAVIMGMCKLAGGGVDGSVAIDVGANIGNHSLFFARHFSKVISFEPSLRNNWIMRANLELNDTRNVVLISKGLSDSIGFATLGNDGNKLDTNNGFDPAVPLSLVKTSDEMIEISTGDIEWHNLGLQNSIALVKIDVEGFEPQVIRGFVSTLTSHKPLVCWEAFTSDAVEQSKSILQSIGYGYFYHLREKKPATLMEKLQKSKGEISCTLEPLDDCENYTGMNLASWTAINEINNPK